MKILIPVREEQLIKMKGKISEISLLTYYHFSYEKFFRTKTDFFMEIYNHYGVNVYLFSPFGNYSEYLAQFFNVIICIRVPSSL